MIRLFASDIDGTLLYGRDNTVSEEMFTLIRKMKEQGILFAAVSGRQYGNLKKLFSPVWEDMVFVSENGAAVFYRDQLIAQEVISMDLLLPLVRMIEADPRAEVALSSATTTYIRPKTQEYQDFLIGFGNHIQVVEQWEEVTEPCVKVAFYEEQGVLDRVEYWQEKMTPPAKVVTSGSQWLDVLYPNSHKGIGMQRLAEHFGLTKEEMLAVGDNYNDMEMLQSVAFPVAMDNAREGVLAYCPYHTHQVEDLAKRILEGRLPEKRS